MKNDVKFRHEYKYVCNAQQLLMIKNRLLHIMSLDKNVVEGQYSIRSLYFDSYNNSCYYDNENGTDPREKYRIRIYNANKGRISLECKRKERGKTYKSSTLLSLDQFDILSNNKLITNLNNDDELIIKLYNLMKTRMYSPKVIVEYDRIPFVYHSGNVRITLDMNIRTSYDVSNFFEKNIVTRPILPLGQHLLEVKFDEFLPRFIKDVLGLDYLQRSTFSKYYLCRRFSSGVVL